MNYKLVLLDNRIIIVDEGPFPGERKITYNLRNDEKEIISLMSNECPKRGLCVNLLKFNNSSFGISSICEHFGFYSDDVENEILGCTYDGQNKNLEPTSLKAESCPENKENCLGCEYLRTIEIPKRRFGSPEKSHAYVRCGFAILSGLNDVK